MSIPQNGILCISLSIAIQDIPRITPLRGDNHFHVPSSSKALAICVTLTNPQQISDSWKQAITNPYQQIRACTR